MFPSTIFWPVALLGALWAIRAFFERKRTTDSDRSASKAAVPDDSKQAKANGYANGHVNGKLAVPTRKSTDERTEYTRWRLKNDRGNQAWVYLESDEEVENWPQCVADKWHLGLPTGLPNLPPTKTPMDSVQNALEFFSKLQYEPGNWACDYGGPMFLLPGVVITYYVTRTPLPEPWRIEMRNYIFARQHPVDGGWGLHIEGKSSVLGLGLNYTALRLLGADAEDPRMVKARGLLHEFGGVIRGPHWTKFWLCTLGCMEWEALNPVPPELWLLPDWVPIAPWRWWIHMRQVMLPMSYIYSKRFSHPLDDLTRELRKELYVQPYESINFALHRNSIHPRDNYHKKTAILNVANWLIVNIWQPYLRSDKMRSRAEEWAWELIRMEDENTLFTNLGPVNGPMNTVACYIREGPGGPSVKKHFERLPEFLWVNHEGMLCNGTNGVQVWDTAFAVLAVVETGLHTSERWKPMMVKALEFLEDHQIREEAPYHVAGYRQARKGAWPFSNKDQGYTVSDCTSEGIKSVLHLQNTPDYPRLLSDERIFQAIDVLLTMQNASGGCASYEPQRGSEYMEYLNAAEVFGRIMVEYDYPECTTAVVAALSLFQKYYPDYRKDEIIRFKNRAVDYIRRAQRPDGSWYGSWGICFSYAGMFALESLATVGETYENSERVRRACQFFLDRQRPDGGWCESYETCETGIYTELPDSQVVQTAMVIIALCEGEYPHREPLEKAVRLIMSRQQRNGEWLQEAIEGVFNKSCMISYPNYKFYWPIKAFALFQKRFGDVEIL